METKYWFFTYRYTRRGHATVVNQGLLAHKHPLLWQLEVEAKFDDGTYEVAWFTEIDKEIFDQVNGHIG